MALSALDENGNSIDWWFIYKVPQLNEGSNNDKATGYEYVYFDPSQPRVTKSLFLLNGGQGALNRTLDSILRTSNPNSGYILYNDERPDDAITPDDGNLGHTKGVIAFDLATDSAFWLLHSWPKFANPNATDDPAPNYGQTYLCLSLTVDAARQIAAQMATHQEPQVYKAQLPPGLTPDDPFYVLSQPISPNADADAKTIDLTTAGGMSFKVIAKNRKWNDDFWNNLVADALGADLDVETWIRGPIPPMSDRDGIHKTYDIKFINLGPLDAHWAWPETHDHAKWAISLADSWVCVGDINRMISQRKRGGGTVAFQHPILWNALSRTSLVLAPPGHTRTAAHQVLMDSHAPSGVAKLYPDKDVGPTT